MWRFGDRLRPGLGIALGAGLTLIESLALAPLHDDVAHAIPALVLVVPVVLAAVVGGRVAGFVVAGLATVAFALVLPPVGSLRLRVSEDVVALVVFFAVAFVVSALVTTKMSALEAIDVQRRALLRAVSHDLRTPLASIHAVATDLRSGAGYDAARRNEMLDVVIDESDRLDRFVANLLSMSRIEAGTMRSKREPVAIDEIVESGAERWRRRAPTADITVDIDPDLPLIPGDHAQLEQVLDNLLDNATRHTGAGTQVVVRVFRAADGVQLVVADNGAGFDAAAPREGVGLVICTAVAEAHHGTFALESGPGGTRVTLTLPAT